MSDESKVTEPIDDSVEGILSEWEAPETFEIPLGERRWTIRGFKTYAEQKRHEDAKAKWVNEMVASHNAYTLSKDLNSIPVPAFRELVNLMERENLEAAYDLFTRVVAPRRFEPAEALKLTKAPQLIVRFVGELTYGSTVFLLNARNKAYLELGKGSSGTS